MRAANILRMPGGAFVSFNWLEYDEDDAPSLWLDDEHDDAPALTAACAGKPVLVMAEPPVKCAVATIEHANIAVAETITIVVPPCVLVRFSHLRQVPDAAGTALFFAPLGLLSPWAMFDGCIITPADVVMGPPAP